MDGNLMTQLYAITQAIDHPDPPYVTHTDATIVYFLLRAGADKLSILQTVKPIHWAGLEALYAARTALERQFGSWGVRMEGLNELPKHVRRLHRVQLHVRTTLIMNGMRILNTHKALPSLAA